MRTILEPQSDSLYFDNNLDPQYVRIRPNHDNYIYIDSKYRNQQDVFNFTTGYPVDEDGTVRNVLLSNQLKMIGVDSIFSINQIPNVNPRNNVVTYTSSNTGSTEYSVIMKEGFYSDATTFYNELIALLNAQTGTTGLTWSFTLYSLDDRMVKLNTSGGSYKIVYDDYYSPRQKHLANFNHDVLASSQYHGPFLGFYTRYYSIYSSELNNFSKNKSSDNGSGKGDLLFRFYVDHDSNNFYSLQVAVNNQIKYINLNESTQLSVIDFRIVDEFNDTLYTPYENGIESLPTADTNLDFSFVLRGTI